MKELFSKPEVEVFEFETVDIITTSGDAPLDQDEMPPIIVG